MGKKLYKAIKVKGLKKERKDRGEQKGKEEDIGRTQKQKEGCDKW